MRAMNKRQTPSMCLQPETVPFGSGACMSLCCTIYIYVDVDNWCNFVLEI